MALRETLFDVAGMSCGSCVRHIDAALTALPGVENVEVELSSGRVRVNHNLGVATVETLISAIADAGYVAKARSPAQASK